MKVLYSSHTHLVSGGERSLIELIEALPDDVRAEVACPRGELSERLPGSHALPGTDASLRLHPWYTARAVATIVRAGWALRRVAKRTGAELVHANSIRAGLVAVAARRLGGPPVVVHVRDRLPDRPAARLTLGLIVRGAAAVVANSDYTLGGLPRGGRAAREAIASPVDLGRFAAPPDRAGVRASLGIDPDAPLLGVVGQLTPWKGQDEAIRTLAQVRRNHEGAQLLLIGSAKFVSGETRFDNPAYVRGLHELCEELGVTGAVHFLGEREDVAALLGALDVLLVPSWGEPFGRVVVEGMAARVPVVATSEGGPAEILTDGRTGILLPPREGGRWADAVGGLLASPARRAELAARAREEVAGYAVEAHVERVLSLYRRVLEPRSEGGAIGRSALSRSLN